MGSCLSFARTMTANLGPRHLADAGGGVGRAGGWSCYLPGMPRRIGVRVAHEGGRQPRALPSCAFMLPAIAGYR